MRVLVTWGSKLGGTERIGEIVARTLTARGFAVTAMPAEHAPAPDGFDAVILGGALYAFRWHRAARHYANRHVAAPRHMPVWLFSSGPLDDSAERTTIEPVRQVAVLIDRIGACGYVTFGGRLAPDARGFVAGMMAKNHSGDWRNPERIAAWANEVADRLPVATPQPSAEPAARSPSRLIGHALAGWAVCAALALALWSVASAHAAIVTRVIFAPLVFAAVANHYFARPGAREPVPAALAIAGIAGALDFAVLGAHGVVGLWLPLALVFFVTCGIGVARSMLPLPGGGVLQPARRERQ
jgi:menaquinone-dependent protoporphyrinogen oxidase